MTDAVAAIKALLGTLNRRQIYDISLHIGRRLAGEIKEVLSTQDSKVADLADDLGCSDDEIAEFFRAGQGYDHHHLGPVLAEAQASVYTSARLVKIAENAAAYVNRPLTAIAAELRGMYSDHDLIHSATGFYNKIGGDIIPDAIPMSSGIPKQQFPLVKLPGHPKTLHITELPSRYYEVCVRGLTEMEMRNIVESIYSVAIRDPQLHGGEPSMDDLGLMAAKLLLYPTIHRQTTGTEIAMGWNARISRRKYKEHIANSCVPHAGLIHRKLAAEEAAEEKRKKEAQKEERRKATAATQHIQAKTPTKTAAKKTVGRKKTP